MPSSRYTFLDFAEEVLKTVSKPMTFQEIWSAGKDNGLTAKLSVFGKTPWQTLAARLFVDTRDNPETKFMKVGKNPARFFLLSRKAELASDDPKDTGSFKGLPTRTSVYPHERQIEYWTSSAIEDYFENEGYSVAVVPNSPRAERILPYDHLFAGRGVKIFGLQYKRLYQGTPDYWHIDTQQYTQLSNFNWIYYALPQIRSIKQRRNALHLLTIITSNSLKNKLSSANNHYCRLNTTDLGPGKNDKVPYYRWGGFAQMLFRCKAGWKPKSVDELREILGNDVGELLRTLVDIYIVPLTVGPVIRITPFLSSIESFEQGFDFGLD